ncbi:MAG TPA: Fic family protein [Euzebyales bacterium]|nr:Fic family protein [Euzebyales bacterium]
MAEADLTLASPYVEALERQRTELVDALAPHVDADLVDGVQRRSARLSVRLDASPLEDATADAVDAGDAVAAPQPAPPSPPRQPAVQGNGAGWAQALKLDGLPTQDIAALEYRGVRAAQMDEPRLAEVFFADPVGTITALQRHVAAGLVTDERLAALRSTTRTVNDAQGRVIFSAPDPQRLPVLLADLDAWIRDARDRHPPLVIAGMVHLRLLHWRPFEAGSGRVARAASRVALRATGGDPWGLATPEQAYADDPLGYATEVAASIRRRSDLRPWMERTGEAVVAGLETVARDVGAVPRSLPVRGVHECQRLEPGETITVVEYAAAVGTDRVGAVAQMNRLCWTGLLRRDAGTHGLRYVRRRGDGVR